MNSQSFLNRYKVVGTLTTKTPLHIGNGDVTSRGNGTTETYPWNDKQNKPVEIAAVAVDSNGAAYIPGSTLKGNIRSWLKEGFETDESFRSLFGYLEEKNGKHEGEGGKLEFLDVRCTSVPDAFMPGRSWDPKRKTCVAASVAIDRHTKTADADKLFHYEFVPPQIGFQLTVTAQNLDPDELELLLLGLEGFNHGVTLGSSGGDGWGRMDWKLSEIRRLDRVGVAAWISNGAAKCAFEGFDEIPSEELTKLKESAKARASSHGLSAASASLDLVLEFDAHFLVNDGARTFKPHKPKKKRKEQEDDSIPDHAPLKTVDGKVLLPASSIRGALRSQAERIFRTIGGSVDSTKKMPASQSDVQSLGPIDKLFGCTGWRAPLGISDFKPIPTGEGIEVTQQFLAIDRFTGGGADGKKFDATSSYKPKLEGKLTLNFKALEYAGAGLWAIALLVFTLRDLMEGDISLGFGSAKGYGACRASITGFQISDFERVPTLF